MHLFGVYPPIGVYIAVLAFMAVVVTLWPPENRWSKAAWLAAFFLILLFEVYNLYRERAQHDTKEAEARADDRERFAAIAKGIDSSISQSERSFDATMNRMSNLAKMSSENLNEITGGDSFCYFTPNWNFGGGSPWSCPLTVWVRGKHPMYNVSAEMTDGKQLPAKVTVEDLLAFFRVIPLGTGTLLPGPHMLDNNFRIVPGKYGIHIFSRNGFFNETMEFKIGDDGRPVVQNYELWGRGKKLYPPAKQSSR